MKLALYRCIIALVTSRLRGLGLRDFFVHIFWPIEADYNHSRDRYESLLKQMVMRLGYGGFSRGKKPTRYDGLLILAILGKYWSRGIAVRTVCP